MNFNISKAGTLFGSSILLVYAFISLLATAKLHTANEDLQIVNVEENIDAHKQYLQDLIDRAFIESRILNITTARLKSNGVSKRATILDFLKSNLENNKDFLGVWMVWEPNAFDGEDQAHIGEASSDATGRFVPYWHWSGDSVSLVRCLYYDESDYYLLPKKHHQPYLLEPYIYPIDGAKVVLVSVVIPIMIDGQFQGVVGVDIRQNELAKLVDNLADISRGSAMIISGNNSYVSSSGSASLTHLLKNTSFLDSLKNGELNVEEVKAQNAESDVFRFATVLNLKGSQNPWKIILEIPKPVFNGNFLSIWSNLLLISGVSALAILLLLLFNVIQSKQLTREKINVENRLLETHARLNSYIEGSGETAIFSVNKNYNYLGFNSMHFNWMKKYSGNEIKVGDYMPALVTDHLQKGLMDNLQRGMHGEVFNWTSLFQNQYYTQSISPIFDKKHDVIGVSVSIVEVTERIMAEQQLDKYRDNLEKLVFERTHEITRQKEFFQKVIDQIPAMVVVRDKECRYVLLNKLSEGLYDKPMTDVIGTNFSETYPYPLEVEKIINEDHDVLNNNRVFEYELQRSLADGTKKWFFFSKRRMIIDDEAFVLGVYLDITALKEAQLRLENTNNELQKTLDYLQSTKMRLIESEKMASIGVLTDGLAHEMNNPINYVGGNVVPIRRDLRELMGLISTYSQDSDMQDKVSFLEKANDLYEEMDKLLEGVSEGASRVTGLIRDLRSFSDPRKSNIREQIDVNTCIQSTLNLIRYQPDKYIDFQTELAELPYLMGSSAKLKQVLLNLLTNSCQSIEKEGTVSVFSKKLDNHIIVEIRDSGSGIPEEYREKIFERFFTTKMIGEGTGLGLAISSDLIQDFGGEIKLIDTSVNGTFIEIRIPNSFKAGNEVL